mmetsp:Transcript_3604/g.14035  ORF Transcript_3604/g.14035 Transcript_3604/m.14035 type:complete len:218 (-) Transcript_3604:65-718(-)
MHRQGLSYMAAFGLVAAKRACIYPNVGFQLQLCLFERLGFDAAHCADFDVPSEIAISIDRTLSNVDDLLNEAIEAGDDAAGNAFREASRWLDFGFFFQNCREYLGHVDIGLPLAVLAKAEDVARRLRNLEAVFEGAGVAMAARVGRVIDVWQALQSRMAAAPGAIDRLDLSTYVSKLADSDGGASAAQDVGGGGPSTRAAANDADDRDSKRARTTAA